MSTTTVKRRLAQAIADAEAFRAQFPPACYSLWTVAGSARRRLAYVGDVEHVIVPCRGEADVAGTLFGETEPVNLLWRRLDELVAAGQIQQHIYSMPELGESNSSPAAGLYPHKLKWGPKMRGCDFRGFRHELYTADSDNLGAQLAIRTGPADFSRMLVTQLRRRGLKNDEGYVWDARGNKVSVPTEQAYFACCGVAMVAPALRFDRSPAGRRFGGRR